MRDFEQEQDFDFDSWQPPTSAIEEQDFTDFTNWIPPTRPIRGASGLGEEVEGKLPPLASEVEKEEFPFTGPMPFSLRENPNRPPTQTPAPEYSKVLDRIGGVAKGTADIWGQPYNRPGAPELKELSVFPTDDEQSVLPEMKSEPETWLGGFGKGLYNEFGRWAANPSTMLSSMEPGPAGAVGKLSDILKIGESPIGKLVSKAKTAKLPVPKTPADVAALRTELEGLTSATPDLSTGIPKPRIDAATFAQMRDARAIEAARAEASANAARVAPDPVVAPKPPIHPRARLQELIDKDVAGQLTGPELGEARVLDKQLRSQGFPPDAPAPTVEPISSMPEMDSRVSGVPPNVEPSLSRIEELGQMPVEELEAIATPARLEDVGTPHLGGMTEPIIPESLDPRITNLEPEAVELPPVEAMPEAIEPEVMPMGTDMGEVETDIWGHPTNRDLTDEEVARIKGNLEESLRSSYGEDVEEADQAWNEVTGTIDTTAKETDSINQEIMQANDEGYIVSPRGTGLSKAESEKGFRVVDQLSDGSLVIDYPPGTNNPNAANRTGRFGPKELPPAPETPEWSSGTSRDDYDDALNRVMDRMNGGATLDDAIEDVIGDYGMTRGQLREYTQGKSFDDLQPKDYEIPSTPEETPPAIESMPEESPWVGEPIVEEPPTPKAEIAAPKPTEKPVGEISIKKAKDFNDSGNYTVTNGRDKATIYRDPESRDWYRDQDPGEKQTHYTERWLGSNRKEAIERLQDKWARGEKPKSKWEGISKPSEGPAKLLTKGEIGTIESLPKETPTPKPTKITPIEEMPIGSLPGEEGITEGIITSQDKADFRAREEEMRKALEGKKRASETGTLEERPSWISEEGEEIGVPSEDKETSRAKAEEMKRALEGKQRAGKRMSMPEMGRSGELPKMETPKPSRPKPPTTSEIWQSQVDALDKAKAPDSEYQSILSTGSKTPLRKKETWRERVMGYIDLKKKQEAELAAEKTKPFSERLKGEKGALTISKGPSSQPPPPPPPEFSWRSKGSPSSGIGSKGPLDVVRESKFGKAIGKAYEESGGGFVGGVEVAGNAMKSAMSTGDLSAPFRQGAALVHKKEFRQNIKPMIEMFKDEAVFTKNMKDIKNDPIFKFADEMGLDLPGLNRGKEERFANEVIESIPGYGKVTRASDRAYTGFLNKTRFDTFRSLLQDATNAGLAPGKNKGLAKEIATFVNEATGRGSLGRFEPASRFLNATIYSPKLGMSRLQMINRIINPYMYAKQSKFVRQEALKSAFAMAGMNLTTNAITAMVGGKVTYDILSSDFAKNKFGDTRVDMGAGFLQPIVLAARIAADKYTSSTSGKTYELGTDYGQTSTGDLLRRFLTSKEAPMAGLVSDLWSGEDWQGKDKNRAVAIGERFTPLILQDMYDIVKEDPRMAPLIVPGFLGASVQTYGKPEKKSKLSMPKMGLGL